MRYISPRRVAGVLLALIFPLTAWADINQTTTLLTNTSLSLDTGVIASAGGDIRFSGGSIVPQGTAKATPFANLGVEGFAFLTESLVRLLAAAGSAEPIPGRLLTPGFVFVASTNGGSPSKVLFPSVSDTSITPQFTTSRSPSHRPSIPSIQ